MFWVSRDLPVFIAEAALLRWYVKAGYEEGFPGFAGDFLGHLLGNILMIFF